MIKPMLAMSLIVLCHGVTLAQPRCYESPTCWSSGACQTTTATPHLSSPECWMDGYSEPSVLYEVHDNTGWSNAQEHSGFSTHASVCTDPAMVCSNSSIIEPSIIEPSIIEPSIIEPSIIETGCGSTACGPVMTPAPTTGGLFGGIDFVWMRASFDQNVAMIIDPPVGNTLVPFDYGYELSPRAWFGWQNCHGTGFRTTYFRFDESANTESVTAVVGATPVFLFVYGAGGNLSRNANATTGQTLVSDHSLEINSFDFEVTRAIHWRHTRALFGLGVRIADVDQIARADVFNPGGTLEESVQNDLQLKGAGPTASAQFTRGIGASPLGVFATTRGSLLVTETEQRIYEMKGAFTTELEDIATQKEILGNLEFGLGLQYGQSIGHSAGMFVRFGYECQLWLDAGGPVDSQSTIGLDGITFSTGVQF